MIIGHPRYIVLGGKYYYVGNNPSIVGIRSYGCSQSLCAKTFVTMLAVEG